MEQRQIWRKPHCVLNIFDAKTDENMQTSISGVYAVGDVRAGVMKQIVTACSDGAIAGKKACENL